MTVWRRTALGALFGAGLVLLFHPITRPSILAVVAPRLDVSDPTLEALKIPLEEQEPAHAAVFADVAMRKLVTQSIRPSEIIDTLLVVQRMGEIQPNNGVWPLCEAALRYANGDPYGARKRWDEAVRTTAYDDYQVNRWIAYRRALAYRQGAPQSWHWSMIYWTRDDAIARGIGTYGRNLLARTSAGAPSLDQRTTALLNAKKIRDGSRSVEAGLVGARLVEGSTYPPSVGSAANPRKLVIARTEMVEQLNAQNRPVLGELVEDTLRNNEGWLALVESANYKENARNLSLLAVVAAALPSGLLFASFFGGLVLLAAYVLGRSKPVPDSWRVPLLGSFAIALGLVAFALTSLPLPALASAGAGFCLFYNAPRIRSKEPEGLGALHEVVLFLLALAFLALLGFFLAGLSQPAQTVLPYLGVPAALYGGSPLFAGLAWICFSLVFLSAPFWAIAQRVRTSTSVRISLEVFGRSVLVGGLVIATISGLASAYLDHEVGRRMQRLVENEPANYAFTFQD